MRSRRRSHTAGMQTLTELNVTPLLDLAFVLLIIFMITTPLMENSIDLVVPTSGAATKAVNPSDVQTISIDRESFLKFNEKEITGDALELQLRELKAANPQLAVVIRPHRELTVQRFVGVMDILQRVGVSRVGLMTQPESPSSPATGSEPSPSPSAQP